MTIFDILYVFYMKRFRNFFCCYIIATMATIVVPISSGRFSCKECDYKCSRESQYNRHIMTRKHILATNPQQNSNQNRLHICEHCNKEYHDRSGLWRHKQKCIPQNVIVNSSKQSSTTNSIDHASLTEKMIELIMSKNQEFITELVSNITNSNKDVMEKMMEIMPKLGNNSHNTNSHNTTNNQFNIQLFLNEHCKNAMNLTDFIDSLPITASTYDSTIENGLTKTITNMITNGLNKLDILERPIHCTDATRKTLYVKEADIWEKDTELLKVVEGIKTLIRKKRTLICRWKEANRGWDTVESKQMRFTELICNIMTDVDFDEKETGKIVRSISKSVYLDSEEKKKYLC
jgi:hypothetical protein